MLKQDMTKINYDLIKVKQNVEEKDQMFLKVQNEKKICIDEKEHYRKHFEEKDELIQKL